MIVSWGVVAQMRTRRRPKFVLNGHFTSRRVTALHEAAHMVAALHLRMNVVSVHVWGECQSGRYRALGTICPGWLKVKSLAGLVAYCTMLLAPQTPSSVDQEILAKYLRVWGCRGEGKKRTIERISLRARGVRSRYRIDIERFACRLLREGSVFFEYWRHTKKLRKRAV